MAYFVQLGVLGHVGRLRSAGLTCQRGDRVVCRTARGLELGKVLGDDEDGSEATGTQQLDGDIVRPMTDTDHLLQARIETRRNEAWKACDRLLREAGLSVQLIDVEHLFDGSGLFFYFLGPRDERLDAITRQLTETYESKVRFREFTEKLVQGCGPDCGTAEKSGGCSTGGCAGCAVAGACGTTRAS